MQVLPDPLLQLVESYLWGSFDLEWPEFNVRYLANLSWSIKERTISACLLNSGSGSSSSHKHPHPIWTLAIPDSGDTKSIVRAVRMPAAQAFHAKEDQNQDQDQDFCFANYANNIFVRGDGKKKEITIERINTLTVHHYHYQQNQHKAFLGCCIHEGSVFLVDQDGHVYRLVKDINFDKDLDGESKRQQYWQKQQYWQRLKTVKFDNLAKQHCAMCISSDQGILWVLQERKVFYHSI